MVALPLAAPHERCIYVRKTPAFGFLDKESATEFSIACVIFRDVIPGTGDFRVLTGVKMSWCSVCLFWFARIRSVRRPEMRKAKS